MDRQRLIFMSFVLSALTLMGVALAATAWLTLIGAAGKY